MPRLERDIATQIRHCLDGYKISGIVLWWGRLNSGKIRAGYKQYIQLMPKGTPDYLALIRNKKDGITALFIEVKSDIGKLNDEQIEFMDKYFLIKDIYTLVIRDIKDLEKDINYFGIDKINQMKAPG